MKNIPPEMDRLLWAVAEESSDRAADEFIQRYPTYAGELARRRVMVSGLKGNRPVKAPAIAPRPTFHPIPPKAPNRFALGAISTLALAAVALGAYTIVKLTEPHESRQGSTPTQVVRVVNPPVIQEPPRNDPQREVPVQTAPEEQNSLPDGRSESGTGVNDGESLPKTNRPRSFHVSNADLSAALTMLGAESGVKIIVAPGMRPIQIDAAYDETPLNDILRDLGKKYGFTPFDQGDGSIIVVPAVETPDSNLVFSDPTGRESENRRR